jgi:ATP-dependent helicase/nuclease subunit A
MDAVKIMTIHAAKGLEFPIVFVPGLEEPFTRNTGENLIYEKGGKFFFKAEPEPSIRRQDDDFMIHQAREEEEQKRLFYVAVTRAEESLFLISHWDVKDRSFLAFIRRGLGLERSNESYTVETETPGLSLLTKEDVHMLFEHAHKMKVHKRPAHPVEVTPMTRRVQLPWKAVTESVDIRRQHGKDWPLLGDTMHRILEGISKGHIQDSDIPARAATMLESKGISEVEKDEKISVIEKEVAVLKQKGIWEDIIEGRENSFAELPFIYEEEETVYTGRIDRLIIDGNTYNIYDYKTFPVNNKEIEYLLREYSYQLNTYKKAVRRLFNTKEVKSFIVFTHTGDIREV